MAAAGVRLPMLDSTAGAARDAGRPVASPVLLVCMPFQHLKLSSLSIGLLATVLRQHGVDCREAYLHFDFARVVGRRAYDALSDGGAKNTILGELLFAEHYHGTQDERTDTALKPVFGTCQARIDLMNAFAECCLERIEEAPCPIVGFSTSFNQLFRHRGSRG